MKRKTPPHVLLLGVAGSWLVSGPVAAELSTALAEAVQKECPPGTAEVATYPGEMDGAPPEEVIVLGGREHPATFLAEAGGKIFRKGVKLAGRAPITVAFHPFTKDRSLVQVSGGESGGSVLLSWNGKKLDTVWESGKARPGESRWFEIDDLDDDGISEVVTYQRAELDVAGDDEIGETSTGSSSESLGPTSVLRWTDGRWREDSKLFESLQ